MIDAIACPDCDLLTDLSGVRHGEAACCRRCGTLLTRRRDDAFERVLAYASAALILLVLANSFSFLAFEASGQESVITLWETPQTLWNYELYVVAILVAAFIIVIPAAVLMLCLMLGLMLGAGRAHPLLTPVARLVFLGRNWAMVEVFIIGVIVSLVKIAKMATVVLGTAFFAYIAFTVCFLLAVSSLDRFQCWRRIELLTRPEAAA